MSLRVKKLALMFSTLIAITLLFALFQYRSVIENSSNSAGSILYAVSIPFQLAGVSMFLMNLRENWKITTPIVLICVAFWILSFGYIAGIYFDNGGRM